MEKIERLMNLAALLLDTGRPLPATEIRAKFRVYREQSDEAFHRMFERDKEEIAELGLVIELADTADGEKGYRISKMEALLDDPGLTPAEMAALSLAGQAWGGSSEGALGVLKLSVGAGVSEPGQTGWLLPRVMFDEAVATLLDAVQRRKVVTFLYRGATDAEAAERTVEPHALSHRGDWYLTGLDRTRGEARNFKLSRFVGSIVVRPGATPDFDPAPPSTHRVPLGPWEGDEIVMEATLAFAPEAAWWVERRTGATVEHTRDDGWVQMRMPVADVHPFAGWIAGFADRAMVLEPDDLRAAVIAHLRAAGDL